MIWARTNGEGLLNWSPIATPDTFGQLMRRFCVGTSKATPSASVRRESYGMCGPVLHGKASPWIVSSREGDPRPGVVIDAPAAVTAKQADPKTVARSKASESSVYDIMAGLERLMTLMTLPTSIRSTLTRCGAPWKSRSTDQIGANNWTACWKTDPFCQPSPGSRSRLFAAYCVQGDALRLNSGNPRRADFLEDGKVERLRHRGPNSFAPDDRR